MDNSLLAVRDINHKYIVVERRIFMAMKLTKANFDQEVLQSDKTVLLDFYADWCGPCRMLSPIIEEIASEHPEIKVCKINVDEEQELAQSFQVMSIPTLVALRDGKQIGSSVGVQSKSTILKMVQ